MVNESQLEYAAIATLRATRSCTKKCAVMVTAADIEALVGFLRTLKK